jgi:23S rRNA (guanosine2251-2'-O)-methyltransferase
LKPIDSQDYLDKKAFFDKILTIYGRNAVLEVLQDSTVEIHKLHLSSSNKPAKALTQMLSLAKERGIEVLHHDKQALSRISKNAKQDQGVALDIIMPYSGKLESFLAEHRAYRIIALDGITNPQNLGMIIRSCAAGNIDAILIPTKGNAQISPLVIKASAGTLFKLPILKVPSLYRALQQTQEAGSALYTLDANASQEYHQVVYPVCSVFVLGNESQGVSREIGTLCDNSISIPMRRGVESLNVAVTASLLAFMA